MNNIPAFPTVMIGEIEGGMTLRDYFAAKAMAGLLSRADYESNSYQDVAEMAYIAADAMMIERDK